MPSEVRAATLLGERDIEVRTYPMPSVEEGGAVLDVELCALCGTDYAQFTGRHSRANSNVIPGHEVVGTIREAHPDALIAWGVSVGDRVVVEPNLPCGSCAPCITGRYVSCEGAPPAPMAFGFTSIDVEPSLWGGYAENMFLPQRTILHRVPTGVTARRASLANVVANAFNWVTAAPNLRYGQSVLILGAGQRGLACVSVARACGAGQIIATGLDSDRRRLEAALALGADQAVVVDETDIVAAVRRATGGEMVDVVVDCTAGATQPVIDALHCVKSGGTVVLAGLKHGRGADGFAVDEVVMRQLNIVGALSASYESNRQALQFLERDGAALEELRTHELPLDQVAEGLAILGGERPEEEPIYVSFGIGV